jgi:putative nucleotidyltransferase with HDIG domain
MHLGKDKTEAIRTAALVHDLGKINVPASILSKPGKISDIEYSMIRIHPQTGYDILKKIEFVHPIAKIIVQHHERLDGSGYPAGLKSKDIMIEAKILSVADVVEAMSSHRPYRPALGIDVALKEIIKNRGILYDAEVVDVCVKIFKKNKFKLP